jgi:hypothetical protein
MNRVRFSRRFNPRLHPAGVPCIAAAIFVAAFTATAIAQTPAAPIPEPQTQISAPTGYSIHQSVDLGGRMANTTGSGAMYDTLVNLQSGPRVQGETLELRALPGTKNNLVDLLSVFSTGYGGDPNSFTKLNASKGKIYDFSGIFRRDRQYFDYDLLGNANIPSGQSIPIGPKSAPTGALPWPQELQSPFLFNTVRRMTDTNLTIHPLSKIVYRAGYSQNIFEGPSLSPSGYGVSKYDMLLQQYQRNSTDDFTAALDWKIAPATTLTFAGEVNHYKGDSYFTMAPQDFIVQEADGTKAAINDYDSQKPWSSSACNANSIGTTPILSASTTPGGLPVINAACAVVTSYLRSAPTRIIYPTEIFRLQSSSIKNVAMNGDFRYTQANMNLPDYYDSVQGLNGTTRTQTYTGVARAHRAVIAGDFGLVWQASRTFSLSEQADYSSAHQPGFSTITSSTTLSTPATAGNETINYAGPLKRTGGAAGSSTIEGSGGVGVMSPGYFGQSFFTNNVTATWDGLSRATFSLTYRYRDHVIAEGTPHSAPLAVGATDSGTVTIHENGGIFNAALRPTANWSLNGSAEILYDDNAFTAVSPRQTKHYRVHTMFRPRPWATISGAFNDLERHNNTNNNQAAVAAGDDPYEGPLNHVDHSRVVSIGAALSPSERYSFDFNYAYSDVYAATNICYDNGATPTQPGTASLNSNGTANVCPGVYSRGSTTQLADWFARDFMDAPTQFGSASLTYSPYNKIHSSIGYTISSVNGNQFFNDARAVNGSLDSTYQSPFVKLAFTLRPGLIWKAEYNFYGYGEGGPSGPQDCSTSTSVTSAVVPCASLPYQTGLTEPSSGLTAPRNFHANNVILGVHYEF